MSVRLVSAEAAGCPILRTNGYDSHKPHVDHVARPHFVLSSLPPPADPYEIPSYPIQLSNEELNFDLNNVANLWFKLLAMQTMNGNFVKHGHISRKHRKTFSLPTADPEKLRKELLFICHRLEKRVLNSATIDASIIPELSGYIRKLENCEPYFTSQALESTAIDGLLKQILSFEEIPLDRRIKIRYRCQSLYDKMQKILAGTNDPDPALEQEPGAEYPELDEELEMPKCCITQLTPEECIKIQEAAKCCDPPLDRAVVELMCILPYFSDGYGGCRDHLVSASAQLVSPPGIIETGEKAGSLERLLFYGPTLPSEMLQLTDFWGAWCGFVLFLDTKTGEGVDFKDCGEFEPGPCEKFEGPRKAIEKLLQSWVDEWLTMYMVPYGESPVCELWRHMDYVHQKRLLQEFNWPQAFPLPESQYRALVERQDQLISKTNIKFAETTSGKTYLKMRQRWEDLTGHLKSADEAENWKIKHILEFFKKYIDQQQELEYVLATGVLIEEKYREKIALMEGEASGHDWSAKITYQEILDKFMELAGPVETWDIVVQDMNMVLLEAFELGTKTGYPRGELLQLPDDDETEDYDEMLEEYEVLDMELGGNDEDESMGDSSSDDGGESDEGDLEDLDAEILKAEAGMELDVVVGSAKGFVENVELPIR